MKDHNASGEDQMLESMRDFLDDTKEVTEPVLIDYELMKAFISAVENRAARMPDETAKELLIGLAEDIKNYNLEIYGITELDEKARAAMLDSLDKALTRLLGGNVEEGPPPDKNILHSIIPQLAIINKSKLALQLPDNFLDEGEQPIGVERRGAQKKRTVIASLATDSKYVQISGSYTAYDRAVLNGICSLWEAGNRAFTPAMVYMAMNGLSGSNERGRYVSPQAISAVTRSIEKQRGTRLTIDCTEQMAMYKGLRQAKFDSMMLSLDGVEMTAQNGAAVKAYIFTNPNRPPVLYEYSKSIKQVMSVSPRLLNSSSSIRSTEEVIVLREYLIRQTKDMKDGARDNNNITYQAIYKELGIDVSSLAGDGLKNTTRRIRKNTAALLDHLHSEDFIKGYQEYKKGREIAGVNISL